MASSLVDDARKKGSRPKMLPDRLLLCPPEPASPVAFTPAVVELLAAWPSPPCALALLFPFSIPLSGTHSAKKGLSRGVPHHHCTASRCPEFILSVESRQVWFPFINQRSAPIGDPKLCRAVPKPFPAPDVPLPLRGLSNSLYQRPLHSFTFLCIDAISVPVIPYRPSFAIHTWRLLYRSQSLRGPLLHLLRTPMSPWD